MYLAVLGISALNLLVVSGMFLLFWRDAKNRERTTAEDRQSLPASIEIAGESPSIESTSGLFISPRNCLAYEESDSTYLLCPSAYNVSKAKVDFPEPDNPVITMNFSFGNFRETFFRLCSLAPFIVISFDVI